MNMSTPLVVINMFVLQTKSWDVSTMKEEETAEGYDMMQEG
jgi:hypothetical protein